MTNEELGRLAEIASNSLYSAGVNTDTILYSFKVFQRHIRGASILEMGPAEGIMTDQLAGLGLHLTLVEGSEIFARDLRRRHPSARVEHSLFENYSPAERFDNIVLGHVLEHVEDPVAILTRVRDWLAPDGRILAAVPNARSLHRQAAVNMGLLQYEEQLNEADMHHGHRRVYTPEKFRHDFLRAGLKINIFGGYWLKPLSNRQIEQTWTPEMLEAFMELGERYPDIAGEIYVVAGNG